MNPPIRDRRTLVIFANVARVGKDSRGFFVGHWEDVAQYPFGTLYLRKTGEIHSGVGVFGPDDKNGFWSNRDQALEALEALCRGLGLAFLMRENKMPLSEVNTGDRVGAIQSADQEEVRLYGYGVYKGEQPCPELKGIANPLIELDNGKGEVWGFQSWWGEEDKIKEMIGGRRVVEVKP